MWKHICGKSAQIVTEMHSYKLVILCISEYTLDQVCYLRTGDYTLVKTNKRGKYGRGDNHNKQKRSKIITHWMEFWKMREYVCEILFQLDQAWKNDYIMYLQKQIRRLTTRNPSFSWKLKYRKSVAHTHVVECNVQFLRKTWGDRTTSAPVLENILDLL